MTTPVRATKAWADEEEDDFMTPTKGDHCSRFTSKPDANGITTIIEYLQKEDGQKYKVQKRIQPVSVEKRVNKAAYERRDIAPFGKEIKDPTEKVNGTNQVALADSEVSIDLNPAIKHKSVGDDEKFWEESVSRSEALIANMTKKKWDATAIRMDKIAEEETKAKATPEQTGAQKMTEDAEKKGAYVPPGMRNKTRTDVDQSRDEITLRVTNLSEDVRDGDLQVLFAPFGRLQRVFLARYRDGEKNGQSKGFAFVTYSERKEAEAAMKALHGHGYDNLILQVSWAKPRAP